MKFNNIKKTSLFFASILCLFSYNCSNNIEGEIQYIYKLSSPKGDVSIYECYIESPYSFGSGHYEITLMNSREKYHPRKYGNLSGYHILGWQGNDTLAVIKFHEKGENQKEIPSSELIELKKLKNINLYIYHLASYGSSLDWFKFDSLAFSRDSVFFFEKDNSANISAVLGLCKGQIKISLNGDSISKLSGEYYERIENHFKKIKEGNKLGYPLVVGNSCEITPRNNIKASTFKDQSVFIEQKIKDYK
jgi:hypothetical protein